jgi:hypothetical protein
VGDDVGRPHLEDMANAGAGLAVGGPDQAPYYEASDAQSLKQELRNIIITNRSCIFRIRGGVVDPGLLDKATITLDNTVLEYGGVNGWNYHQDRKTCEGAKQCISLEGTACETLQDGGDHVVQGDFLCTYIDPEDPPDDMPGGDNNGTGGDDGPGPCVNPGESCTYDGDCCSGVCGGGTCITQ